MDGKADVRTEIEAGVGWIIIDRPEVGNAARPKTMREMCEALDRLVPDPAVKAIVLMGEGEHFLAGGDFDFLTGLVDKPTSDVRGELYDHFQGVTRRLFRCAKPTIAAVSGAAITVGCELALMCDVRIVTPTAIFQESWLKMGLMPPLGGAMLLPRLIGLARAKAMILEGRPLSASESLELGFASEITPLESLRARAEACAGELAQAPPLAYRAAKEALHRGLESTMEIEWSTNVLAQSMLIATPEFRAALEKAKARLSRKG